MVNKFKSFKMLGPLFLCSIGWMPEGFSHSTLHRSCWWRGSSSLPCHDAFISFNKQNHIPSSDSITSTSTPHRPAWSTPADFVKTGTYIDK